MTDITIKRACEVLRAEGYNDAAQYLNTWAAMPSALRDVYPLHDVTPPERNQPTVAEIAERLAEVEQRQDEFEQRTIKALNAHDERFDTQSELRIRSNRALDQRIDKVAEIIGDRVTGLVNDNNMILDSVKRAHERLDVHEIAFHYVYKALDQVMLRSGFGNMSSEYPLTPAFPNAPAFPTGGADTAEAAAEAVLPVPQRGDRVRLEGAVSVSNKPVPDGWYDVIGHSDTAATPEFQIAVSVEEPRRSPWMSTAQPGLKEVRHADHT